ncbi:MAG: glycosyltransferase family 4 protein [Candidatus Binatus sp.]
MRILFVPNVPFPSHWAGGIQTIVEELGTRCQAAGHTVTVLSPPLLRVEDAGSSSLRCVYLPIPPYRRHRSRWRRLREFLRKPRGAKALENFLELWRPDIVNSHLSPGRNLVTLVHACNSLHIPLVESLHAVAIVVPGGIGPDPEIFTTLQYVTALTAVSDAVKTSYERVFSAARNAKTIIGGVDTAGADSAMPFLRQRPYIFSAGRLKLSAKAVDTLISGFAIIAPEYPDLDLLIAGAGPDRTKIERQIVENRLSERVQLLGPKSRLELWSLYKGAILFASPSRVVEGLGLVFLESMACGTAVIATGRGGTPEIVLDGETGLLLETDNSIELASKIRYLLNNPTLIRHMGEQGRKVAARYSWDQVADAYMQVYRFCVATSQWPDNFGRSPGDRSKPEFPF